MPRRITLASLIDKAEGLSLHAVERTSDEERSALEGLPDELFSRIMREAVENHRRLKNT